MKIVKYNMFKLAKDALGFGHLCGVMGVTFSHQQCDCLYHRVIIFNGMCHIQTGKKMHCFEMSRTFY